MVPLSFFLSSPLVLFSLYQFEKVAFSRCRQYMFPLPPPSPFPLTLVKGRLPLLFFFWRVMVMSRGLFSFFTSQPFFGSDDDSAFFFSSGDPGVFTFFFFSFSLGGASFPPRKECKQFPPLLPSFFSIIPT